MKYTIYKDETPQKTVTKIKQILNNLEIELDEIYFNENEKNAPNSSTPFISLRVETINHNIGGTNGKGTNIENAKASAYAEYMERLQNLSIGDLYELWSFSKDRKNLSEISLDFETNFLDIFFEKDIFKLNSENTKKLNECIFLPFYNIAKQRTYNLPHNVIIFLQATNGMAAGNTYEEALVQGLSEIVERYSSKRILQEKIELPSIPEKEYLKYEKIEASINHFNEKGINVHIKDASLGGALPVICTIFETNGIICPVFGAHPSFPIAIERTLTEFVQGRNYSKDIVSSIRDIPLVYYSKEKFKYSDIDDIYQSLSTLKTYFENNKFFEHIFFSKNKTNNFEKKAWIDGSKNYDNKKLLKFLLEKINKFSKDIFIRDVSFLNFPTIQIFIPNISELKNLNLKELKKAKAYDKWTNYNPRNRNNTYYNANSLLTFAEYYQARALSPDKGGTIFETPLEYVAFLCSILLKKPNKIKKYYNILKGQNKVYEYFTDEQINIFCIIYEYFKIYKKSKDEIFIKKELEKRHTKRQINKALNVINKLTLKDILSIFGSKNSGKSKSLRTMKQKLLKYIKNDIPEQMKLKEHLSFLYEEKGEANENKFSI